MQFERCVELLCFRDVFLLGVLSTRLHEIRKGNVVKGIIFSKVVITDTALFSSLWDGIPLRIPVRRTRLLKDYVIYMLAQVTLKLDKSTSKILILEHGKLTSLSF